MTAPAGLRGLYAITSAALCADPDSLRNMVAAALRGGAVLIQYRDKHSDAARRFANAGSLRDMCRAHGARLVINDDIALAVAVGADGVHLGASDGSIATARAALGAGAIIGASCGPSLARAQSALDAGASYVAFGRFFDSRTKPDAPQATLELLAAARRQWPAAILCAIGGVTPDNGRILVAQGADLIAAVEGVFAHGTPDRVEAAARAYAALF